MTATAPAIVRSPAKITSIEACRGVAALMVLSYHAILITPGRWNPFMAGYSGVDFFFVLSGFIICYTHTRDIGQPDRLGRYLKRRLTRIFPTYWAVLIPLTALLLVAPSLSGAGKQSPWLIFQSFVLWPQAPPGDVPNPVILGVSWSLTYEIAFYGAFAVLIFSRRVGVFLFALWSALILAAPFIIPASLDAIPEMRFVTSPRILEFFLGMLAAVCVMRLRAHRPHLFVAAGILVFAWAGWRDTFIAHHPNSWWTLTFATGAALALYGFTLGEVSGKISHAPQWLAFLGAASYSIYLVHYPALRLCGILLHRLPVGAVYWLSMPLAALAGICFHLAIERPLTRALRQRSSGRIPHIPYIRFHFTR